MIERFEYTQFAEDNPLTWAHETRRRLAPVIGATSFKPYAWVLPRANEAILAPRATLETSLNLQPGTVLYGFSAKSQRAEDFQLMISDARTKERFWNMPRLGATLGDSTDAELPNFHRLGQYRIITAPGVLNFVFTNRSAQANRVQIVLWTVTP